MTISIIETHAPLQTGPGPARTSRQRVAARLQQKAKLGTAKPSDEVEGLKFSVFWEPTRGALGVVVSPEEAYLPESVLFIVRFFCFLLHCIDVSIRMPITLTLSAFYGWQFSNTRKLSCKPSETNHNMDQPRYFPSPVWSLLFRKVYQPFL